MDFKKIVLTILSFALVVAISFFATVRILDMSRYDFSAKSANGDMTFKDLNGKYRVVYFGYTFCPDVCPLTLEVFNKAMQNIDSSNILLLFISLDPKRDSAESLQEYAEYFYPNSLGLWMDEKNLKNVASKYGVKYENIELGSSQLEYSVAHSTALFLFDKKGELFDTITNLTEEEVRDSIERMINQ